jgi:hypothetical protein
MERPHQSLIDLRVLQENPEGEAGQMRGTGNAGLEEPGMGVWKHPSGKLTVL